MNNKNLKELLIIKTVFIAMCRRMKKENTLKGILKQFNIWWAHDWGYWLEDGRDPIKRITYYRWLKIYYFTDKAEE